MSCPVRLATPQLESPRRPVVVLAIDDEDIRAMYAYAVTAAGFDVMTDQALTDREGGSPQLLDVIVADVSPGSRHGWTFVRKLKRDRRTSDIAVIAIAADAGVAACERARHEGCVAMCSSTCPADVLASGLRAVLNRFR